MRKKTMRLRRWIWPAGAILGLAVAVPLAFGARAPINNTDLTGGGGTSWDPEFDTYACTDPSPPIDVLDGFSPVDDGQTSSPSRNDAFDGGLVLFVKHQIFRDFDGFATKHGNSLSVGPDTRSGLKVSETETALQGSPTLRVVAKFQNTKGHKLRRPIRLESALGSDNSTRIETTSSGDQTFTAADRWIVTSDSPDPLPPNSDPPVTHVLYGKHAAVRDAIEASPAVPDSTNGNVTDCLRVRYNLAVPAHQSRYLMFFAEMNRNSNADAVSSAQKFNSRHLSSSLLGGVSGKVRQRILNWGL